MQLNLPRFSERLLNEFASKQWSMTLEYLKKQFSLSEEDCQDVFQDAFIILHQQNQEGRLKDLSASLSTYFIGICRNKALELCRGNEKMKKADEPIDALVCDEVSDEKVNAILQRFDCDAGLEEQKDKLVRQIVRNLPEPCNSLLWGVYRDNLSMKALALMYNYTEGAVRVIKHRCMEKFRMTYTKLLNALFD